MDDWDDYMTMDDWDDCKTPLDLIGLLVFMWLLIVLVVIVTPLVALIYHHSQDTQASVLVSMLTGSVIFFLGIKIAQDLW